MMSLRRSNSCSRGFTLLEVLVALFVLSVGLLGLAALQIHSLSLSTTSYFRTQATVSVYDLIDRMRSNRQAFLNNGYHTPNLAAADAAVEAYEACDNGGSCDCGSVACNAANLAIYDLGTWYKQIEKVLPQADGQNRALITRNATTNEVTIRIQWVEKDLTQTATWLVQL
jgi:type IV pilus assembly protein PilV